MLGKSWQESRLLWHIAFPAILTAVFQFSIGSVTVGFAGHIGEVELAAVTVVENVVEGFAYGVLVKLVIDGCSPRYIRQFYSKLGMGSALETLCGQAVGAGQVDMLGIYIQRSWIICGATALLFAYAANFPLQKFFQAQSKVWAMTFISGAVLALHVVLNYVFVTRLGHGLFGAAMIGNVTWWIIIVAQFAYLVSGCFPEAWKGFSMLAFSNLAAFVRLSLASAVMLCLELWYYTAVLILVGLLKNAQLEVDIMSVCINYQLWTLMVALGFNAAVSVRVSNELGANRPKAARFSVIMAVSTSAAIGAVFLVVFLVWRTELPRFFSDNDEVGIWVGMSIGTLLQTAVLLIICFRTKWDKQAMLAEERIREWGGSSDTLPAATTTVTNGSIYR
ncbi:Protein TRANSPARENT TESTA 12 [Triticum urartu]|uniref:Protein TRANSPARENT TESTA 12 n=1 Tax=Triticum urartu TaxID=4572 RepID=M7YNM1_TRIUA|nr:Protein TRANSPARENT TESTA 12 [Triticum urartu]